MSSRCQAKVPPKGLRILVLVVGVMVMHPMVQAVTKSPYKQTQVIYRGIFGSIHINLERKKIHPFCRRKII